MVKLKVPATSANLGAGFDCVGLAVSLYNYVYMDFSDELEIVSLDDFKIPTTKANLIYRSAVHLFDLCDFKDFKSLSIKQKNNIPQVRGLGSSSACIVAGLFGANALLNFPFSRTEILNIATRLEGHPDNVAPSIFGSMVVCAVDGDVVYSVKNKVSDRLKFVFFIPSFKMETKKARKILKEEVSLKDAVFNISRSSFFVSSILQERFSNLKIAVQDRFHQDVRLKLIENGEKIFSLAYSLGAYGVYLSGAGPSIVAICDVSNSSFEKDILLKFEELNIKNWDVLELKIDENGADAQIV